MFPTLFIVLSVLFRSGASIDTASLPVAKTLSEHTISLEERYGNKFVNDVFKDNMLLTLNYMDSRVNSKNDISWPEVGKPFHSEFVLNPGETFAFHDRILPEYAKSVVKTTEAHFNYTDGFKSDGYLMGDGVCHLASLIYWSAKDAGLTAIAPRNHDFAKINQVPKEYGVAIYASPTNPTGSQYQNLYITNNKEKPVVFTFDYDGVNLKSEVFETI